MKSYLTYGDRVTVTSRKSYKGKYFNCTGTVHNCSPVAEGKVGVTLDGLSNPASSHGCFWFARHELTLLQGEEEKHDTTDKEENSMLIPGYVVARVVFLDDKSTQKNEHPYAYALYSDAAREGDLVREGDTVVVMTGHHGPALAEVVRIDLDAEPDVVKAESLRPALSGPAQVCGAHPEAQGGDVRPGKEAPGTGRLRDAGQGGRRSP